MLRAVSAAWLEPELCLSAAARRRRDVFELCRARGRARAQIQQRLLSGSAASGASGGGGTLPPQTVLSNERVCSAPPSPPPPSVPPSPPPPPPRRSWTVAAAALALTASLGGVYFYRKMSDEEKEKDRAGRAEEEEAVAGEAEPEAYPASGSAFPRHVQYLLVGGGTASFAAMRAIRSARPDAAVLIVGEEPHPPYMRPPLSKELWREPELGSRVDAPLAALSFRQWNGRRRALAYEPLAFYTPVERLAEHGGAGVARGWTVARLDVARREAELRAPGAAAHTLSYERCLLAPGARARRLPELRAARDAGRALALRDARDAARLARALADPAVRRVALLGGGFLATELGAALADRLGAGRVLQVYREEAPLARVLPAYLARDAARRLRAAGVDLLSAEVEEAVPLPGEGGVELRLRGGAGAVRVDLVVECAGVEPADELARAAGLELHPTLGGVVVNAELQARTDLWAAGDVACFYDETLGRRRVEHHDHAVVSGRLAGENMAGATPPKPYSHQSMFWSDLGPSLGYEAIGLVDAALPTVGVFAAEAVHDAGAAAAASGAGAGGASAPGEGGASAPGEGGASAPGEGGASAPGERRYERGVVFYVREQRVVGVLLWNLFNRMHVARQVLAHGHFDDLFEVAKLFTLHEDD